MKSCNCQGHRRTEGHCPAVPRPWNVPPAFRALEGKHIIIRKPHIPGSVFYNYKDFFSVVLLALVGAHYNIILIDTGGEDHQSDRQLFGASEQNESIDDNTIQFSDSEPRPNVDRDTTYYVLGDDAFPLRTFFVKPYGRRWPTTEFPGVDVWWRMVSEYWPTIRDASWAPWNKDLMWCGYWFNKIAT